MKRVPPFLAGVAVGVYATAVVSRRYFSLKTRASIVSDMDRIIEKVEQKRKAGLTREQRIEQVVKRRQAQAARRPRPQPGVTSAPHKIEGGGWR